MHAYRCYFLDETGRIKSAAIIEAEADTQAIDSALAMLVERPRYCSVELWERARKLYPAAGAR